MNFVLGLAIGGAVGWFYGRQKMEWQIANQQARTNLMRASQDPGGPAHAPAVHATQGYFAGVKAPTPGPPPAPPPGSCPVDMMWDPVNQECVPVLPWPIQQG